MAKKTKRIREFVMNRKTGHTSYAFKQSYDMVNSLGFTHNKNDFAKKQKLNYNINPKDNTDRYVKTKVEKQKYNTYRKKEEYGNYRIHKKDEKIISTLIKSNKKGR